MRATIREWLFGELVRDLATIKAQQKSIMATLENQVAEIKTLRNSVTTLTATVSKVQKENADLRQALTDQNAALVARVEALEKIIADGQANQETIDAIAAEVSGLKSDVAAATKAIELFDADLPDATPAP